MSLSGFELADIGIQKEVRVVQASLLGSILANLLLILGMCFVFGGLRFREQVELDTKMIFLLHLKLT